jgi:transcriptional regulator with XRE-family HTH domain
MPESRIARADDRARNLRIRLGAELRLARVAAGLSQHDAGRTIDVSASEVSRIERGLATWVDLSTLCRFASVVGMDLWARLYPGGEPLRDVAHLRLADAFRSGLGAGLMVRAEVPIGDPRDLRAWDLTLDDQVATGGVELETRLIDAQAQLRKITLKVRDSDVDRVLMVVADTRANRLAVRTAAGLLGGTFAIEDPAAVEALRAGRVPPRDALLFLRIRQRH